MRFPAFGRIALLVLLFFLPFTADAAPKYKQFEVSGWIPYWRVATGTADVIPHLSTLTEVNPFGYSVKNDGTLNDTANLKLEPWDSFMAQARANNLRVIPTVMWSNSEAIHRILSDGPSRRALADEIAKVVKENNFDGIDIDFEGKKAETRDYFSTFLKALSLRMPDKWIMCTIEARTPIADRYYGTTPPPDAGVYTNDLRAINTYCDRVRIMTYDQQGIDLHLAATAASSSALYAPVADPAWVEKVINLMAKDIKKSKIMIGVPTYGYEYDVTVYAGNQYAYKILWTFNPGYAMPIAREWGIMPGRNSSGELYFTYSAATSTAASSTVAVGADVANAAASQFATAYNSNLTFRLLDWPDEQSVAQKIALARRLGVRGISIFKLDGGQDPDIWNTLAEAAVAPISTPGASSLTRSLRIGSVGADVKLLQLLLNSDPDTQVALSGPGSPGQESTRFGTLTRRGVEKFQMKYGIAKRGDSGFGLIGPRTRAKMNELIGVR